ncbi:GNAT family N-acetyltransferase [Chryseosolibacter indicus]|uniref:GNAT family N-acetyltransferase n=1 Tax=Chryseosolibacter indicus TaxID=2782351 RepID=A0ABS5VXD5_9BACT|nr:GNAT family N-acetyltransferase [Chryseosolibacter indicus]MBT1705515.1 GNAT family N-acetyltransferase [Chryseosolibacter indicus]
MKFRDAVIDDLADIVAIYNSTIPSRMVTADTEPISVESRREWFYKHTPDKRPLWIVEDYSSIVGWVGFHSFVGRPAYNGTAEISVYLHEQARGKGYGTQILAYSISRCKELGITNLLAIIFSHNEPSLKLFRKFGFQDWGHLPNVASLDGVERSVSILGKRIDK